MTDDAPLIRRFVLRSDAEASQLWAFLRQRHELLEKRGKFFSVVVSEYSPTRRLAQNSKLWVGYLDPTAAQVRNPRMDAKGWHFVLKCMFLPDICASGIHKWKYLKNGDRELSMSTGDLNEDEFDVYLHEVGAYVSSELGVHLPQNPRDIDPSRTTL